MTRSFPRALPFYVNKECNMSPVLLRRFCVRRSSLSSPLNSSSAIIRYAIGIHQPTALPTFSRRACFLHSVFQLWWSNVRCDDQMIAQVKNARCITVFTIYCAVLIARPAYPTSLHFVLLSRQAWRFAFQLSAALCDSKSPPAEILSLSLRRPLALFSLRIFIQSAENVPVRHSMILILRAACS